MEVQTETYRAAMKGTLERHFSDMIAIIPIKLTIDQLKHRLETLATTVDELKIIYNDETSLIVELHMDERIIPYEIHIDATRDAEEYKMYNRQDATIRDDIFEDTSLGTEIFTRTLFVGDVLSCFYHQLQFLWQLAPDLLFVIDSSAAMKVLSRKYIEYYVENELLPDIPDLYIIHSVYEDGKEGEPTQYWFHTHGLLRAGVTEVELIIPNRLSSYYGIPDLFQTFANNTIENGHVPINEPIIIAQSQQGTIHTVAVPWEKGLSYIGQKTSITRLTSIEEEEVNIQPIDAKNSFLGGMDARDEYHQSPSVLLFNFNTTEEYIESFFNVQKENTGLMFYKTNAETDRMAYNAKNTFGYFSNIFHLEKANEEFRFLAKFGISYEEDKSEHMWFEMKNITEDNIHGLLINHPYFIEHMTEGTSYNLDLENLTEWIIYAGDEVIKPSNLYMFFE
ncbi:DUF4026 domain-containing protein [Bacillus clarus]|uniref:DUF4026 domain-containing protein n=1 Tax=Bacillus clarus TaxID=2338372 RepID=A0A090YT54_9BACI|nr:DUF4026 domain-containing protein [Bacillus clarus]KFN02039.1 hypothetical protein DJ93_3555 [Bacillus clarus]RFT66228.1 DUF4026 domain-containing protein [Bacillus clarus]